MIKLAPIALLLCSALPAAKGQEIPATAPRQRICIDGAFLGLGRQENTHYPYYRPFSIGAEAVSSLRRYGGARQPGRVVMMAYVEPLLSFVQTAGHGADWEGGATAGGRLSFFTRHGAVLYLSSSAGPFYYSADVERQAPGFVFSDNFNAGIYTRVGNKSPLLLNTQVRWRHLSNASTRSPNGGINTVHFIIGISRQSHGRRWLG